MADSVKAGPTLTTRLTKAFGFAYHAHLDAVRKGTEIPYLSHPMGVAAIVLEHGGSEDQAIAALLHDTVEDCGVRYETLAAEFGPAVARFVEDCTDAAPKPGEKKPDWRPRKERYIEHARKEADPQSLLVSAADKLHNARAIVHDVKLHGPGVWKRFNSTPDQILWYYESLVGAFRERSAHLSDGFRDLLGDLQAEVSQMRSLAVEARR